MHFEVPKAKKFKEFGGEYVMIVISILTALALEHAVQSWHHRHLAHEAADKMNAELRVTIKDVSAALAHNEKKRLAIHEMRKQLLAGIRAKTSDAELMQRFEREWQEVLRLDLDTPGLRREAWEAAVANQAVTWMPREQLERYAGAYGMMRETSGLTYNGTLTLLDMPHLMGVMSNVQMGISNPQEIYRLATQMVSAYDNLDSNLQSLNKQLQTVVDENGGAHAAQPKT
ncbi:hypothetical protein SRABI118_02853 [Massilia sp. Bi118]|uniref:hypothetical protein n=1 Tax=Massilia sp. Bi118 TaxID=2822346 RepID=UPI001DE36061|nr:hypothetical protein [Massilia sp. Bi118]CAH0246283.1 hypothetical protein SRABI118_02853 [Massilia sp. Bi118]